MQVSPAPKFADHNSRVVVECATSVIAAMQHDNNSDSLGGEGPCDGRHLSSHVHQQLCCVRWMFFAFNRPRKCGRSVMDHIYPKACCEPWMEWRTYAQFETSVAWAAAKSPEQQHFSALRTSFYTFNLHSLHHLQRSRHPRLAALYSCFKNPRCLPGECV